MTLDGDTDLSTPRDPNPDPDPEPADLIPDETLCFKEFLKLELNIFVLNEVLKYYSKQILLKLYRYHKICRSFK